MNSARHDVSAALATIFPSPARQRHHHLRARHHPDGRLRRRGRRLQSRQFGQGRDAGCIDSTALMLSKDAATLNTAQLQTKANDYFTALFTRPEAAGLVGDRHLHDHQRLAGGGQGLEQRQDQLHGADGHLDHECRRNIRR